ncbi:hypothetical protein CANARDRAFT_69282 [[Candida] arabinofermentans NRRL YB-2248]|uniref:Uncharacterized protein n=1 Tax=[Candida] arabinofermentans NRRL YB-2248 TaxID=983967 RepID=A0A1E4SXM2_9ASCO|nr:hypothetical protein CANARDRAFT_69282 [[Candida] arabinofermentans NRRL YB-2248]
MPNDIKTPQGTQKISNVCSSGYRSMGVQHVYKMIRLSITAKTKNSIALRQAFISWIMSSKNKFCASTYVSYWSAVANFVPKPVKVYFGFNPQGSTLSIL